MIGVHKRARTIVDGFPRNRHIVGIHDAMDEANTHPFCDQPCLDRDDVIEKRKRWIVCGFCIEIVSSNRVVSQNSQCSNILSCRKILKRSDPNMTACHTG
jgi:hypothetical protein